MLKSENRYHFAEHIPGWPSGKFKKFFTAELKRADGNRQKEILLNTVIFSITGRCPLRCSHCFEWDNLQSSEHLQTGELFLILDKLKPLGLTNIQFGGGEPLARFDDLLLLIERARKDMDCWILTSGYGLTSDKAIRLKRAGLSGASISLDHWEENAHNQFRNNEKSFWWVREAVKNCREAGIVVTLAFCATKQFVNPENIARYYELAREWGAGYIKILEARKTGRFRDKDVMPDKGQVEMLVNFYLQSYKNKKYADYPIVMYPGFDQRQTGCLGAGNRYMYIDSRGEIHACPFCHGSAGNAIKDAIPGVLEKLKRQGCQIFELSKY
jgi:MoaA/NifB/PqqE/SkfB family radical SAM enzyme